MDFALMSCPYCSRTVDSSDPCKYVCLSCGKSIYTARSDVMAFTDNDELKNSFESIFDAFDDDFEKKAREIADGLVESTEGNDRDSLFIRGYVHARMGEDGKALADWKKGLELLSNDINLDGYICLVSKAVCDMILFKEKEFIEFDAIAYIDKICDEVDSNTGMSCKAFIYYSIYRNCLNMVYTSDELNGEFDDVIPRLIKRIVAYHRNYWCLPRIIQEYLDLIEYDPETYEDDDNEVPHVYELIGVCLKEATAGMNDDDRIRIFDRWNDASLKAQMEPALDALINQKGTFLGRFHKKEEGEDEGVKNYNLIRDYVDKCLLLAHDEEPVENVEN